MSKRRSWLLLVVAVLACCVGCRERPASKELAESQAKAWAEAPTVKVWVSADGTIEVDGVVSDMAAVNTALDELAKLEGGVVYYGRDDPEAEPHPNSMLVMQAIVKRSLPLRLSTHPDFSDSVGPNGKRRK